MRALIYARFSSDAQRVTSIDDQVRLAAERCAREGWTVVERISDEAISGSVPVALRRAGKRMLELALREGFDVLVLEGLDRLSRDSLEQEKVVRSLEHRGVRIVGLSDGYDSVSKGRTLLRGVRGLINAVYLEDLAYKTHRGLSGQFDRGLSAGGRSYGYRTEPRGDGRAMVVDQVEAAVVRRVFERYAGGTSVRAIVYELNAERIPSARGGTWAVSALYGSGAKGLGMLRNAVYIGQVVWNRRQWLKDPETGKRHYVERPREDWQEREQPELRIVSDELWHAARARERTQAPLGTRTGKGAVPRTLFGGLLQCPECGGPMVAVDARRYGCNLFKDRGPTACGNRFGFPRLLVDKHLVALLRDELLSPAAVANMRKVARAVIAGSAEASRAGDADARTRLREVDAEVARLVDAVATVGISTALRERLAAAEAEREALAGRLQAPTDVGPTLTVEEIVAAYRRQMLLLEDALRSDAELAKTRALLADMLGTVRLVRDGEEMFAETDEPAERMLIAASGGTPLGLVARARNASRRRTRLG